MPKHWKSKFILFLLTTLCFTGTLGGATVHAEETWGSNVVCYGNEALLARIYSIYGGSDWYPVTVILSVNDVEVGKNNLKAIYTAATNGRKIRPVLRLATSYSGGIWTTLDPSSAAGVLNAVNPADFGIPTPVYVTYGNEPNMVGEWGGTVDPAGYGASFRTFAGSLNSSYAPLKGPLNLSFPTGNSGGMDAHTFYSLMGNLSSAAGLGSNPYELTACDAMPFNICSDFGIAPGAVGYPSTNEILSIPKHVEIDAREQATYGGPSMPRVFPEFGLKPDIRLEARKAFLERAYAESGGGDYRGTGASIITPLLLRDREAGAGELLPHIAVFKDAGGVEFINCNTDDCGSTTCNGGTSGDDPWTGNIVLPPVEPPPVEPPCTEGMYSLTIKGTIKSDQLYEVDTDASTGENTYTLISHDAQKDKPVVNNLPVKKAVIQVHNSFREYSMDTGEDGLPKLVEHTYNSGFLDGMMVKSYTQVKSGLDGTFEVKAVSSCKDVYRADRWRGKGYEQFLSISCADQPEGKDPGLYSKDNWGMVLDIPAEENAVVNLGDINVSCHYDPESKYGAFTANGDHKINPLNRDVYMSCSGNPVLTATEGKSTSYLWQQGVVFDDTFTCTSKNNPLCKIAEVLANWLKNAIPFGWLTGVKTETRTGISSRSVDLNEYSAFISRYLGVKGGFSQTRARFFRFEEDAQSAGADTINGHEEKPKIYSCLDLRRCNSGVGESLYPNDNMQTCGGSAFTLSPPFGNVIKDADGKFIPELSGYASRFVETNKDRVICNNCDVEYKISDIMPPEGYCGDVDGSGKIDGGEMACPEKWRCGDEDGDGYFEPKDGEVRCEDVRTLDADGKVWLGGPTYKLDVRYFPYFAIFSPTTEPLGESAPRRTTTLTDSYLPCCPRGESYGQDYVPKTDPSGKSKPMNASCRHCDAGASSNTFFPQEEAIIPGLKDNETNFGITKALADLKSKQQPLPFMLVGTPQFPTSTDPVESLEKIIDGMKDTLSLTNKGHFYRIGAPSNLCTCSLVETTGTDSAKSGLGKCIGEEDDQLKATTPDTAPNPVSPSNTFNFGKDEGKGNYGEWRNKVYNPEQLASKTAGGADWKWKVGDDDSHYTQPIATASGLITNLAELVKCAMMAVNPPSGNAYTRGTCTRVIQHLSLNQDVTAWELPKIDSAPLIFEEAFYPPEVQVSHLLPTAVALENELLTKPQEWKKAKDPNDMPGGEGTGNSIRGSSTSVLSTDMVANLVGSPVRDIPLAPVAPPPPSPPPEPPPDPGDEPINPPGGWCGDCECGCGNSCHSIDFTEISCSRGCAADSKGVSVGDFAIEYKKGDTAVGMGYKQSSDSVCTTAGPPAGSGTWELHFWSNCSSWKPACQSNCGGSTTVTC